MSTYYMPDLRTIVENRMDSMKSSLVHVLVGKTHHRMDSQ